MSEAEALFAALRQAAEPDVAEAVERLVQRAPDPALCRINALDFADRAKLDEERVIAGLLHATRLGLFDLNWNILCRSCGGVLDTNATLRTITPAPISLRLLCSGLRADPRRSRRSDVHGEPAGAPDRCPPPRDAPAAGLPQPDLLEFDIDLPPPETFASVMEAVTLDSVELPPGDKGNYLPRAASRAGDRVRSGDALRAVH